MVALLKITRMKFFPNFVRTLCQGGKYDTVRDIFILRPLGNTASVQGWVERVRISKAIVFINVNDGSCKDSIQVVIPKSLTSENITVGTSVCSRGKVGTDHRGNVEINAESIDILGECVVADFPFTPGKKESFDFYRRYLHHRPKLSFFSALLRTRHSTSLAVHKYFKDKNFIWANTPILTSNDCEGAGETFVVRPSSEYILKDMKVEGKSSDEAFFDDRAFLTVSGQFHLEALTRGIPKVYTFGPTFRAENSKSRLHLSEFYMIEAEQAFIGSLKEVLNTMEELIKSLVSGLISDCEEDVNFILGYGVTNSENHLKTLKSVLDKPFTVMSYSEAKEILNRHSNLIEYQKPEGLTKEEELFLVKHNENIPIFVIDWPKALKPFYAKSYHEKPDEVQAVDLLVPVVGELCGGSVREDDYEILKEKLKNSDTLEQLNWYLELRKFGNVPTGGFGMGFERFLQFALNIQNIKDTIPFPRWPHNLQM